MKSPLRRRLAAVALVLATPLAAACTGRGFDVQTDQVYQPSVGENEHTENIDILNALIVSSDGSNGTLSVSLVNDGDRPDALEQVTGEEVQGQFSPVRLPVGQLVNLSEKGEVSVTGTLDPGTFVEVELSFRNGDTATMTIPVVEPTGEFADVPLPSESPSASESPSSSSSESPSSSESESPSGSPSESPSGDATTTE